MEVDGILIAEITSFNRTPETRPRAGSDAGAWSIDVLMKERTESVLPRGLRCRVGGENDDAQGAFSDGSDRKDVVDHAAIEYGTRDRQSDVFGSGRTNSRSYESSVDLDIVGSAWVGKILDQNRATSDCNVDGRRVWGSVDRTDPGLPFGNLCKLHIHHDRADVSNDANGSNRVSQSGLERHVASMTESATSAPVGVTWTW